ncbi:Hypothetical protein SRAE_X000200200 [Strongyloides ratti]|uniref:Uncharacterized protein n=1 Tax=Strongyloides ratti TaxID=34506 RepID=A0A090KYJ1_STRRB|nr:Hypothetical protein SRAE_X000200200 [Strongyloides ratti]CEF60264.1 Hypothetical protein SRAE_X000200200 [Strongyloides ratti]
MHYVFCPACFLSQNPRKSRKVLLNSLMLHFLNYHGWRQSENVKFYCVEEACRDVNRNEHRTSIIKGIRKKGQMQLKSYYNHCLLKHTKSIRNDDETKKCDKNIK